MSAKVSGAGEFECPQCHRTARFVLDIEVDAEGHFHSSRAKAVVDDHAPTCSVWNDVASAS